jgi:DNA-binding response OmpR family regulator
MHILVVDRDPANCQSLRMGIEADGAHRASVATSVEQAFDILRQDPPDAAIAEIAAPRYQGLVLARCAVDLKIPVLVMTGDAKAARELRRVGCRYLVKPLPLAVLEAELRALLDERIARTAALALQLERMAANRQALGEALATTQRNLAESKVKGDMLHAAGTIAILARQALRIFEERQQRIIAHVEEIVPEIVVGRLAAIPLIGDAPHMDEPHLEDAGIELHGGGKIVGDEGEVIDTPRRHGRRLHRGGLV